jgi:hypothetical protein
MRRILSLQYVSSVGLFLITNILFSAAAGALTLTGTPPSTVVIGHEYAWKPSAVSGVTGPLQFGYINLPNWSKHYRSSGLIRGTPTEPGVYANIQIIASDGVHYAETKPFSIKVLAAEPVPVPPTLRISGTPPTSAEVSKFYSFTPTVMASAGSRLTYSIANKPAWADFSTSKGTLTGTPTKANVGKDSNITITVSNGETKASLQPFAISVAPLVLGSATLSWEKPTKNTNGTPLTNLVGYVVRYGLSSAVLGSSMAINSASTTEATIENLGAGTWYFEVASLNSAGVQSEFTTVVSKKIE